LTTSPDPPKGVEKRQQVAQQADKVDVDRHGAPGVLNKIQKVARDSGVLSIIPNASAYFGHWWPVRPQRVPFVIHQPQPTLAGRPMVAKGQESGLIT
jgi:branched-chain amino acid transport system substrate-binding protein